MTFVMIGTRFVNVHRIVYLSSLDDGRGTFVRHDGGPFSANDVPFEEACRVVREATALPVPIPPYSIHDKLAAPPEDLTEVTLYGYPVKLPHRVAELLADLAERGGMHDLMPPTYWGGHHRPEDVKS